jgi:hypothetical protein
MRARILSRSTVPRKKNCFNVELFHLCSPEVQQFVVWFVNTLIQINIASDTDLILRFCCSFVGPIVIFASLWARRAWLFLFLFLFLVLLFFSFLFFFVLFSSEPGQRWRINARTRWSWKLCGTYSIAYLSKDQSLTPRTTVEKKEIERTTVQRKRVSERKGERDRQRSRIETRLSQRELYRVSIKKRNQHNCYKITVTYLTLLIEDRYFSNIHHRIGPCDRSVM